MKVIGVWRLQAMVSKVDLFSCSSTGHVQLDEKVNGLCYDLEFQLSLDCVYHARSMAS